MDRIMVRVSSSKGCLTNRFLSPRGISVSAVHPTAPPAAFSFQTFIYALIALFGVFLVAHFVFTASESSRALRSTLRSVPAEAILQAQLIDKEREIEKLRWEIDRIRNGVNSKDNNIFEQEGIIRQLKTKALLEHDAKTKAELALSDRAGALQECQQQKSALVGEVAQCHFDLKALLAGEGRHAISTQSSAVLNTMTQLERQQQTTGVVGSSGEEPTLGITSNVGKIAK